MVDKICVIPARQGSKRIVKKNTRFFFGKPLIWWTINAAIKSNIFSDIIVSSDDEVVLNLADRLNVTRFSRTKFVDDFATSSEATIYTLSKLNKKIQDDTLIFQLLPTCPLRTSDDIKKSFEIFSQDRLISGISGYEMCFGNPHWLLQKQKTNKINFIFPNIKEKRSQDLESLYILSGAIWISKYKHLIENKSFKGDNTGLLNLSWLSCLDIDTEEELIITEKLADLVY